MPSVRPHPTTGEPIVEGAPDADPGDAGARPQQPVAPRPDESRDEPGDDGKPPLTQPGIMN